MVGHRHRFLEAFRLIVHAARADGVDVAPVFLVLRVDKRITVDFAGGSNQHPRTFSLGQTKQIMRPKTTNLQRLDRHLQIVDRASRTSKMQDIVQLARDMDKLAYVVVVEGEILFGKKMLDISKITRYQVIHRHHFVAFSHKAIAKVRA
jgi:hypothetical protein